MKVAKDAFDEMVAHAREDDPNECCGMFGGDGMATEVRRITNEAASPLRFEMNAQEQYNAWNELEEAGGLIGIYHSHTRSAAFPSQTDVNWSKGWPGLLWIIVSLENADDPDVRGFWIRDAEVEEVELDVV